MIVEEIMTKNPITAEANAPIGEALAVLFELDVRHLPIVDDTKLVGIISDRDVRVYLAAEPDESTEPQDTAKRLSQPVSAVMSSDVLSVSPEMELTELVDLMLDHKVGAVPVVNRESDDLVGIVSYMDVLRAAQDKL